MNGVEFFNHFYQGAKDEAPLPKGLIAKATGTANGSGQCNHCQCDCYECAGGDTGDDQ